MEKIILGLLMYRGMTIYEIKTFIQKNLESMCSASAGSLHIAVQKLLEKGFIRVEEADKKKIYYLLDAGREEFEQWIEQPMDIGKAKNIELSKLFFMGLSKPENRENLIQSYIQELKEEKKKLEAIQEQSNQIKPETMETKVRDIFQYQQATLQYGLASVNFEIDWYTKWLEENKEHEYGKEN